MVLVKITETNRFPVEERTKKKVQLYKFMCSVKAKLGEEVDHELDTMN